MKRDMDLVRQLLLEIEAGEKLAMEDLLHLTDDPEKLGHHIKMLFSDTGFLTGIDVSSCDGADWLELELTWLGYEYLENVRDPEVWRKTKESAVSIGSFSIDTLKELAKGFVKMKIEAHTGIRLS